MQSFLFQRMPVGYMMHHPERHLLPQTPTRNWASLHASPIKLPPLHINPILPHRHPQILHRQHRPPLPTRGPSPSEPRSRPPQRRRLPTILLALSCRTTFPTLSTCNPEPCSSAETGQRVVGRRVRATNATVLVGVRCDVGDEFLGCEGEEAGEAAVGFGGWGEAGEG